MGLFLDLIKKQPDVVVGEDMVPEMQWDLTNMALDELCSFMTVMFVGKVSCCRHSLCISVVVDVESQPMMYCLLH